MSINNCCCGETTTPPPPGVTAQQSCALSETIMSQTGLITDLNCGIKPVVNEILGVQMQSTRITVDSVPAPNLTSTEAKDTFVFGYALSRNMCETTSTEGEEERFVAIPYPGELSPIAGTIPCYWVWWTKNRSLELDIKFPNNNFSGCIEQDRQYYVAENSFWCGAYADNSGLQGAWSHDGNSCWRGSQWAPSDLTNLYSETDGNGLFGWTDYAYVDHYQSAYSISNGSGIVGFGCCTGWGHSNCSPADWQMFGVNEVGGYHNEGSGGHQYYSSYELKRLSHHNPKYPASTIEERLAAATVGGGSCYDYEGQGINKLPDGSEVHGKQVHLHKCWRNDQSNPRRYDFEYGDAADKVGANCKDVVVNGLTPYQRRVSQERSPDIWEIHEFNDSLPIKIKVQDFSIDRPAVVKIWGLDSEKTLTTLRGLEDGISKYTDISCGGNNISLVRQNFEPRIYSVYPSTQDTVMVSPTKSRKTIIIGNGNVINTDILQGAEMLYLDPNGNWKIGGSGSGQDRFPSDNFIKKVSTGFNHTICTRDNYTAEVSKTTVNESGDRQYYSSSIPTAIEINSGVIDYNQIDIPYSPGSKRFKYDWIAHDCTADGCTSCKYPLFANKDHTVTQDDQFGIVCGNPSPDVGNIIKIPSGSCRFTNTNPNLIEMSCGLFTPWCAPCFGFDCPLECPPDICYPGDPMINPGFGVLSCQGSDNNWNTVANLTKCTATPTPFCNAGYPPLICGTPEGSNQYICGTGGFNSILHDYTDYKQYSCTLPELETTNYDKNYCEGVQVWDSISAGGYHNVAINKHSNFSAPGATSCTCPNPETNVYPFGDAYNPGKNVVAWGAGENYSGIWPHFGQSLVPANIGHCKKVSGGAYHSLAIDENDKIRAWGAGGPGVTTICPEQYDPEFVHFGQSNIPDNIKDIEFIEISAGQFHSCGIRKDNGLVMCWGAGWTAQADGGVCQVNWGQSIVGATLGKCISISAGGYHTCAITELGTVKCWGKNVNGQCTAPSDPCVQISCGLEFSAGRFIEDLYETFPYWNHSNQRSSPALATDKVTDGFWPISLYRYFFAFASMEFTYGRGETPLTPGICDVDWGRSLPKAYHQRSDAVHIFAFETEIYNGNDSGLAEQLMEEDLSMYIYQGEPIQVSWGHMGDGYSAVEPGWHTNANKVNRNLSDYYWADRMSCKDWRQEIWDDLTIINGAAGLSPWPALADLREKYSTPSKIKPVGAYRIRGDKFDIRDARGNELNTVKRPPELAKMACTTVDNNPTFTNLNCVGRIVIPPEYYDSGVEKYTLQVNSDIYGLTMPDNIYFNREQLDAYNRLTLSVYFRPKPIGWEYSGPDWAYSDWPTPEISATTGGARSWRYGWLQTDRRKSRPRTYTDKGSTIMSTGIGTNTLQGNAVQAQPFWDTYNRGHVDIKISSTLGLTVSCDFIGPQVAYTYNAHIYAARHLPGINTKGGVITQSKQGTSYPMQYEPKRYTCSLFNIT